MVAHMNAEALARTIETGEAWYYSRSRQRALAQGRDLRPVQRVVEMRVDCDQDAVWIRVERSARAPATPGGGCFYRAVPLGAGGITLEFRDGDKVFDPQAVYGGADKAQ